MLPYKQALSQNMDAVAVMAGDGQMGPEDLMRLVVPIVQGEADYTTIIQKEIVYSEVNPGR